MNRERPRFLSEGATRRIFTSLKHESLPEAILSDLADSIPIIGDVFTYMRGTEVKDDDKQKAVKKALLGLDFIADLLPGGFLLELLAPANTFSYLADKGALPLHPKLSDLRAKV